MLKLWTLFCLGLVLTSVYSQSCADTTALRAYYGFAAGTATSNPQGLAQTGINYCNSIKNGPVCCSAADMNNFQNKSDTAILTLTTQAGLRDIAFAAIGVNPATVQASLNSASAALNTTIAASPLGSLSALVKQANASGTLNPNYAGFGALSTLPNPLMTISPANPGGTTSSSGSGTTTPNKPSNGGTTPNGGGGTNPSKPVNGSSSNGGLGSPTGVQTSFPTNPGNIQTGNKTRLLQTILSNSQPTGVSIYGVLANYGSIVAQLSALAANITSNLVSFQQARSTCVVQLYKIQAASWCLSCDVNATLKGYDPTRMAFTMGSDVCNRLKTACYPYIQASNLQNNAFNLQMLIATLNYASAAIATGANPLNLTYTYTGQQPASIPPGCNDATSCNWICTNLFNNGQVNTIALIDGGNVAPTTSRLLSEERELTERALSSGTFNPADTEAGTTVNFAADPAGVQNLVNGQNNAKSGMLTYGSVLGGMIAMIWSMMM